MLNATIVRKMSRNELIQYTIIREKWHKARFKTDPEYNIREEICAANAMLEFEDAMINNYDMEPPKV